MFKNHTLVFISDEGFDGRDFTIERTDGEGISVQSINEILEALTSISDKVVSFTNLDQFKKEIVNITNPIVVNSYYGEASPDSKSIVPTICELNNIPYIGADAYAQMICNDKYLTKKYLEHFNLKSANSVIIYNPEDKHEINELSYLKYPVVIKPNYGGGSNGISSDNVKKTKEETIKFIKLLYSYQKMPILVEEYMPGNEVCVIMAGTKNKIDLMQEVQIIIDNKSYYTEELYGLESKKLKKGNRELKAANLIQEFDKENMIKLFQSFSKIEFMRIDCRVDNGVTSIIELSPDSFFGCTGAFYKGFEIKGYSFKEMLILMIENCLNK